MSHHRPPLETSHQPIEVTVILLDGGYASTSIGPIEIFHCAGTLWNRLHGLAEQPRFHVRSATANGAAVQNVCHVGLIPSCSLREIDRADIIIVPATGSPLAAGISSELLTWLRHWHQRGAYIAGICTGVAVLAECGLLDGRQATTHWAHAAALRERYPGVRWQPERFLTEDGHIFCGGGIHAAMDLSLFLVERFCGSRIAQECARALLLNMSRTSQTGYATLPPSRPHGDPQIHAIEEFLRHHLQQELPVSQLAGRIELGTRSFMRRFKAATGYPPGTYLQLLRIAAAKQILENETTVVAAIAPRVGYTDLAFFRHLFKRHTGMTPSAYRQQFGQAASGA